MRKKFNLNSLTRNKYRKGTIVYIENETVLKDSFATWPKDKLFKVSEDETQFSQRWIWVDHYSMGIDPKYVRMADPKQRILYRKNRAKVSKAR